MRNNRFVPISSIAFSIPADDKSNRHTKMKDSKKDKELFKKAEKWLWAEGKRHSSSLGVGAIAMLVSSYSNQGRNDESMNRFFSIFQT